MVAGALLAMAVPFVCGAAAGEAQTPATQSVPKKKPAAPTNSSSTAKSSGSKDVPRKKATVSSKSTKGKRGAAGKRHAAPNKPTAQTIRLTKAFKASEQLRPMAQQLAATRSAAAYNGVESYAREHPGEGAAAAYLALGHAYTLDRRYAEAVSTYRQANASGIALDDYADYLGAQAAVQAGHGSDAYALLDHFAERHPESIFDADAPVLLANAYVQQNNPQAALRVLEPLAGTTQATHADFRYTLGRAYQMSGDTAHAAVAYRNLYVALPLSVEAAEARAQLQVMGVPLSAAEQKVHADQLFNASVTRRLARNIMRSNATQRD